MLITYDDKEQVIQDLKDNGYVIACVSRDGRQAFVGPRNRIGFGSHEPLLQKLGGGSIDDFWRYTFNTSQGAVILFTIPKYSGKSITPSDRATDEIFEAAYDARKFWEKLSAQLGQELGVKVSPEHDMEDPDGLFAYYKAQILKGLRKQAEQLEQRGKTAQAVQIRNFIKRREGK